MTVATQRLYLTADQSTVVGHDDPTAAFLLCGVGQEIPKDAPEIPAHLLDSAVEVETEPAAEPEVDVEPEPDPTPEPEPPAEPEEKAAETPANKAATKPANKGRKRS